MAKTVKVYSTPTCPYCKMAKSFLDESGIKYSDVDVSSDRQAADEMIQKSDQMGVPVLDIGGTIVIGFDKEAIKAALGLK
jgi:glutaredoxin-like YruB-family protein